MNTMKFGEKLIAQRKKMHLTQEQLAEKMHISRQAISRWENENLIPDGENLIKLSEILEISIDFLLADDCLDECDCKIIQKTNSIYEAKLHKISLILILIGFVGLSLLFILSTQIEVTEMKPLIISDEAQINSEQIIPHQTLYAPTQTYSFFPFLDYYNLETIAGSFLVILFIGLFSFFYSLKKETRKK